MRNEFLGVLTADGYFMDVNTFEWTEYPSSCNVANNDTVFNNIWSYQGKPTNFGKGIVCDGHDDCHYSSEVVQFDPQTKEWNSLGFMNVDRTFQVLVEVPKSFCNMF